VPSNPEKIGGLTLRQRDRRAVTDVLVGAGYDEIYTLPLVAPADLERAAVRDANVIEVENPLRAEESILRPSLLPGVLRAVAFNASHGVPDVSLFETGTVFMPAPRGAKLPDEHFHVAFVRSHVVRRAPHEPDRSVDVYDARAVLDALGQELRIADIRLDAATIRGFHPGRAARVVVDGEPIGSIGEIANAVVAALDLPAPIVACELEVDALVRARRRERHGLAVSRFPASTIDLAFVVADTVPAAAIEGTLRDSAGTILEDVALFDVFRSDVLGAGNVSLAFTLRFRAPDRTLTDEEVGTLRRNLIDAVAVTHGAQLRG
jgi:phenylalanyl-tRNA synthetase beta chain